MEVFMAGIFKNFFRFFEEQAFCDVTLVSHEGLHIPAHKIILASASRVFHTMFTVPCNESKDNLVSVHKIDSEALELIVKFAYTFKVDIKENNVVKLLMASTLYDLRYVKELCFKYIKENINPTNCIGFIKTLDSISDKEIYNFCWSYFLNNFTTIVNTDATLEQLYEFPIDVVIKFIKHDDLVIDTEEKIFDFIIGWISYDTYERNCMLPNLMKLLRLPSLSKEGLQRICNEPLVRNNIDIMRDIIDDTINRYVSSKPSSSLGRSPSVGHNVIFAINTESHSTSGSPSVMYMDIRYKDHLKWKLSDNLLFCPPRECSRMIATENGIVLAIGGKNESGHWVNLIDELDLTSTSKQWIPIKPLNQPRFDFAVCTWKQFIYVVGGCDFSYGNCFNSVEYYDTNSKVWTQIIETMPTARRWCSALTSNNQLYVFGGKNRYDLAAVECYDFEKKNWKQLVPMPICNSMMGITKMENYIYIIGGVRASQRVFKFDLQHSKWSEMPKTHLKTSSYTRSSVVNKEKDLFLFVNEGSRIHCEIYDTEKKQWRWAADAGVCIGTNIISFNERTLNSNGIHLK